MIAFVVDERKVSCQRASLHQTSLMGLSDIVMLAARLLCLSCVTTELGPTTSSAATTLILQGLYIGLALLTVTSEHIRLYFLVFFCFYIF